jgi:UDP-N-acetylmuramoyl-tripeptide--D-alanyl-D-alanine ligase
MINATNILAATRGRLLLGSLEHCQSVSSDSRTVGAGNCFVAIRGQRFDGHDFVVEAIQKGAGLILVDEIWATRSDNIRSVQDIFATGRYPFGLLVVSDTLLALGDIAHFYRHYFQPRVIGITGSNGKTTVKELTAAVLAQKFRILRTEGNQNNLIGLPQTLLRLQPDHQVAVLEMGMNDFGEIARLADIAEPDAGVITNVGYAHVEKLKSLAGVKRAKGELFEHMPVGAAIALNLDDPNIVDLAATYRDSKKFRVVTFGRNSAAEVSARNVVSHGSSGTSFELTYAGQHQSVLLHYPGEFNILNALAAATLAIIFEVPLPMIAAGLEAARPYQKRMELMPLAGAITLMNDCYNANPQSMQQGLKTLRQLAGKSRAIAVLGDMFELGDYAETAHRHVGEWLAEYQIDQAFLLGNFASVVSAAALARNYPADKIVICHDHAEIGLAMQHFLRDNDWVLVKGSRGMRMEIIIEQLIKQRGK